MVKKVIPLSVLCSLILGLSSIPIDPLVLPSLYKSIAVPNSASGGNFPLLPAVQFFGVLSYQDRQGQIAYGRNYYCRIMEYDYNSDDDILYIFETARDGYYISPLIENFDPDSDDGNPQLDIYIACFTYNPNLRQVVFNAQGGIIYGFASSISFNVGLDLLIEKSLNVTYSDSKLPSMWLCEDILRTYENWNVGSGYMPPRISIVWQDGVNSYRSCENVSCFITEVNSIHPFPEAFIRYIRRDSADTVVHETARGYMYGYQNELAGCPGQHGISKISTPGCAWTEGWAEFLPLYINGDPCYDFGIGPCSESGIDLEAPNFRDNPAFFNFGPAVEGRVAAALYDLVDMENEDFDKTNFSLYRIARTLYFLPAEKSFDDFWNTWIDLGNGFYREVDSTFFLNTLGRKNYLPFINKGS